MEVIPAIDLRGGRCVRLVQGDYERELVFSDDPVAVAKRWEREGAPRLHVVDLDGARDGRPVNSGVVREIIRAVELPVQVAGGVRDIDAVQRWLEAGADRAILGTAAIRERSFAAEAARRYSERVAVSIDARDGEVAVQGWTESAGLREIDLLKDLAAIGVRRFVYTNINVDGTLTEPNYEAVETLVHATDAKIISAGGVATVEHVVRLAATGVEGAITGRAIYDGGLDLRAALAAAASG